MKSRTPSRSPPGEETDPIDRLLEAERRAEESVVACRAQAEERLEEARHQARRIFKRTHKRITAVHARCAEALEEQGQALWDAFRRGETEGGGVKTSEDRLRPAVEVIAARLTGGGHV